VDGELAVHTGDGEIGQLAGAYPFFVQFRVAARAHLLVDEQIQVVEHALVAAQFDSTLPTDMQTVADLLASIPMVKERIRAVEEYAYEQAKRGIEVPGYKIVDKMARRQWKAPDVVVMWAKGQGIDPYGEPPILSPAQMEAKLKEKMPKGKKKEAGAALEPLVEKISSGTVLVPVSDNRAPVKALTAEAFDVAPSS